MSYSSVDAITSALDEFRSTDDNDYRLGVILEKFKSIKNHERALPSMFALLERFPIADFGSPGSWREVRASGSRACYWTSLDVLGSPRRILGIDPDGNIWTNEGGNATNNGHYTDYLN